MASPYPDPASAHVRRRPAIKRAATVSTAKLPADEAAGAQQQLVCPALEGIDFGIAEQLCSSSGARSRARSTAVSSASATSVPGPAPQQGAQLGVGVEADPMIDTEDPPGAAQDVPPLRSALLIKTSKMASIRRSGRSAWITDTGRSSAPKPSTTGEPPVPRQARGRNQVDQLRALVLIFVHPSLK